MIRSHLTIALAVVAVAYLLGSISWSYLIVKVLQGRDVRTVGSGNAGATNVLRAAGKAPAVLALLLDAAKGVAAVEAARVLGARPGLVGAAAVAVVFGHVYPVFFGFRGGKGVATSAGAMGALALPALALTVLLFVLVVAWKRYISLGSVIAGLSFPAVVLICQRLGWVRGEVGGTEGEAGTLLAAVTLGLIVVWKHLGNLRRIVDGTEPRLGERGAKATVFGPTGVRED